MASELEEKTERLVKLCADEQLGGVLLNSQPNFAWLTAGGNNGVDSSRENGVATLFVRRDGRRFVLASKIELERIVNEELQAQDFEPVQFAWEEEKANPSLTAELAQSLIARATALGSDIGFGSAARVVEGSIARARFRLTDGELERYRLLGKDAGEALGRVARSVEPGLTEVEIARRTNDALSAMGARSIVTLVAADDRIQRYRHPVPKDSAWQKLLMIVVCARRHGLVVSLSRIVSNGKRADEFVRRLRACARVNAELLAATRLGTSGSELFEVAARAYRETGFPGEEKLHHQGGAAGYRTRDWVAHPASTDLVHERQAFAWNPTVTGAKVEETCIAFAEGVELITTSRDWPTIAVEVGGRGYLLPDALDV